MKQLLLSKTIIVSLGCSLGLLSATTLWIDYQLLARLPCTVDCDSLGGAIISHGILVALLISIYSYLLWQWQRTPGKLRLSPPAPLAHLPEILEFQPFPPDFFSPALNHSPLFLFAQDSNLRYIWVYNPPTGLTENTWIGQKETDIWHPHSAEKLIQLKQSVLNTGVGIRQLQPLEIKGETRYFDFSVQPLRNSQGKVVGVTGVAIDITQHQQAEIALRQSEEWFRCIFEEAPIGIATIDLDTYQFLRVNRVFRQMLGYSEAEFINLTLADITHPDDWVKDMEVIDKILCNQMSSHQVEKRYLKKNGDAIWGRLTVTFLCDQKGRYCYSLGMVEDITDRKQAEEMRLALETEKLLRSLQLRFFSMASHEFRTPLSTILVTIQLLKAYTDDWPVEKRIRNLERIEKTAKNMTQLLDDILTLNRAETGKLDLKPVAISLIPFFQEILAETSEIATYNHEFQFAKSQERTDIIMDKMILHRVLVTVLENAIKYSPEGGLISLKIHPTEMGVILEIQDQGMGIPAEDQPYLFEPFYRGRNVGNIPGTGLGLAVTKKCLDLQNGTIKVSSQEGAGTTVIVTLKHQN